MTTSTSMNAEQQALEKVERLARPLAAEMGLVFYDIEMAGGGRFRTVRVYLDRPGTGGPGTGITVDELARVNRHVSDSLEIDDPEFGYVLEFSSPGVERELRTDRQFELNLGRRVRVVCGSMVDGRNVHEGVLVAGDVEFIELDEADGRVRIPRETIRRARTVYDFGGSQPAASRGAATRKSKQPKAGGDPSPARK